MFRIFRSEWYDKKYNKLDKSEQEKVTKIEQELKLQPFNGKPLGYKFFREKKLNGKRLLFLVYEEHSSVLLITITDKKAQQQDINLIKQNLDRYRDSIKSIIQNFKLLLLFHSRCHLFQQLYLLKVHDLLLLSA